MYCSTCGARVPAGRHQCDTCGTPHRPQPQPTTATGYGGGVAVGPERNAHPAPALSMCPKCGYRGEGLNHFSRGSHVALLVGLTLFTAGAMGAGGLIYYVVRRDHRVCPRCGHGWGKFGELALVRPNHSPDHPAAMPSGWGEAYRQGWAMALFVLAAILTVIGVVATEAGPLVAAGLAAAGGLVLQRTADREREKRRAALISSLQLPVLQLAAERGGRLTVTEVAASLGWTLPRAEKVLQSLDDDVRVSSEVTDEGVIVYQFRELLRTPGRISDGQV